MPTPKIQPHITTHPHPSHNHHPHPSSRYHPHAHGSTVIQTPTANGLIIVEDDPRWLPDDTGCGEVRALLEGSREVVLHLALLPFKAPTRSTRTAGAASCLIGSAVVGVRTARPGPRGVAITLRTP